MSSKVQLNRRILLLTRYKNCTVVLLLECAEHPLSYQYPTYISQTKNTSRTAMLHCPVSCNWLFIRLSRPGQAIFSLSVFFFPEYDGSPPAGTTLNLFFWSN